MAAVHLRLASPSVGVLDVRCRSPRAGPGPERGDEPTHLALVRRGAFVYHLGARAHLGDACTALLHRGGDAYRVSHPVDGGDDLTVLELAPGLADEAFGASPRVAFGATPRAHVLLARLRAALAAGTSGLPGEEAALELVGEIARAGGRRGDPPPGRRDRRLVDAVKARLAAELDRNLPIGALAAGVGASPFHLMRVFRATTGMPVRAYRRQLRVLAALEALEGGRGALARLALELGFAHHAHLTDAFRSVLGSAPRTFLEARRGGRG
ncbi:MAG: AraC family transcriptional regulator [Anaeromyxobacteraceae bacterium]